MLIESICQFTLHRFIKWKSSKRQVAKWFDLINQNEIGNFICQFALRQVSKQNILGNSIRILLILETKKREK